MSYLKDSVTKFRQLQPQGTWWGCTNLRHIYTYFIKAFSPKGPFKAFWELISIDSKQEVVVREQQLRTLLS